MAAIDREPSRVGRSPAVYGSHVRESRSGARRSLRAYNVVAQPLHSCSVASSRRSCSGRDALASTATPQPSPEPDGRARRPVARRRPRSRPRPPPDDERGGRDVVREVRAHRTVARGTEARLRAPGARRTMRPPDVDVRVELAGDDARHVERGRPEVEEATVHRRAVDQLARARSTTAAPDGRATRPSRTARGDRCSSTAGSAAANRRRARRARPPPRVAKKRSPLLISCTTPNCTSPERRVDVDGGSDRDRHAARLRARPPPGGCRRSGRSTKIARGSPNST